MSSDCFYVKVKSVSGKEIVFDILTSAASGYQDYASSRSFVLKLLSDSLVRASDFIPVEVSDTERQERWRQLDAAHMSAPINVALEAEDNREWYVSEPWMKANVGRFVDTVELVERRNVVGEEQLRRRLEQIKQACEGALYIDRWQRWLPMMWESFHSFVLRATVVDEKWAKHLEPGLLFGTTAYDVWSEE